MENLIELLSKAKTNEEAKKLFFANINSISSPDKFLDQVNPELNPEINDETFNIIYQMTSLFKQLDANKNEYQRYIEKGKLQKAKIFILRNMDLLKQYEFESEDFFQWTIREQNNLAILYRKNGKIEEAKKLFLDILDQHAKGDSKYEKYSKMAAYAELGNICALERSFEEAINYTEKAAMIIKDLNLIQESGQIHEQLGYFYFKINDAINAIKCFKISINYFNKLKTQFSKNAIGKINYQIGEVMVAQKNFNEAIEFYNKSIDILLDDETENIQILCEVFGQMGNAYLDYGSSISPIEFLESVAKQKSNCIEKSPHELQKQGIKAFCSALFFSIKCGNEEMSTQLIDLLSKFDNIDQIAEEHYKDLKIKNIWKMINE